MTKASGGFEVTSWHEETIEELDGGGKLTRAWGDQAFSGDIEGDGAVTWLMAYLADVFKAGPGPKATYELDVSGD